MAHAVHIGSEARDVRIEGGGGEFSDAISELLHDVYKAYGMDPVRVPVLPVAERAKFILDNL